jgi:molybdate transport system ATP-binding protein
MEHLVVLISNNTNKQLLLQQLLQQKAVGIFEKFNTLHAQLFSAYALEQLLLEEEIHGLTNMTGLQQSLRSMSSGERKKFLLSYLLSKKPGLLILDDALANLDTAAQHLLQQQIEQIAAYTTIIQIIHRKKDRLLFIKKIIGINEQGNIYTLNLNDAGDNQCNHYPIPAPANPYQLQSNELVRFTNVNVSYNGRQILQNINWVISAGEFWQLKGPNGAGKTTLLTMINGDNPKAYGQDIFIFGRKKGSGETVWEIKNKIGYLTPAMTDLFSTRHTVEQMIISGFVDSIGLYLLPTSLQQQLALQWLQLIQLTEYANKPFCSLSAGQQRLALIARAMVKHPPLLILDEPLAGLDDDNAALIINLINKMAAESSTAILYVAHQTEKELQPEKTFELVKTEEGSVGIIK